MSSPASASRESRTSVRSGRRGARIVGGWLLTVGIVGALGLSFVPAPYAIEQPGPVFDTLGEVTIGEESDQAEQVPLISVPGEQTYPTEGTLSMLTVNVVGNREAQPTWLDVAAAWGDPSRAVVPLELVYPEGETLEQSNEQSAVDMQNSQREAIAAALGELDYDLESTLTVATLPEDSPSAGILEEGDEIVDVGGSDPADVGALRQLVAENGTSSPLTVDVLRDGEMLALEVTPVANTAGDGAPILGIGVEATYDFPFEVKIQLENVGGPSAGMMFALGIIDKLTPGALNGGTDVAGTGTIDGGGTVGSIGGIRQKLYGARDAGAEYFLAPEDNCDQVVGHVPDGLTVFSVGTLDDALAVMEVLSDGGDTADLPACSAP